MVKLGKRKQKQQEEVAQEQEVALSAPVATEDNKSGEYASEDLARLQATLLEMLHVLDAFCIQHDITYFLDSGTALGALRHKGFIPWDDDVDVGMLREDYDRFCELAAEGMPGGCSLHTYNNTPNFAGMFAKMYKDGTVFETRETRDARCPQSIFIDIFPYDFVSADPKELAQQKRDAAHWQRMSYLYHSGDLSSLGHKGLKGVALQVAGKLAHVGARARYKREELQENFNRVRECETPSTTDMLSFPWPYLTPFKASYFTPVSYCWFEDALFPVPRDMKSYLTNMYGSDYMELPPVEKRHVHAPLRLSFGAGEGQPISQ